MDPAKVRYLLTVEYVGTNFVGWQRQSVGRTVQQVLEEAIKSFLGEPALIHGSSRTDAGVHALGNTAHLDICRVSKRKPGQTLAPHEPSAVLKAINHFLRKAGTLDVSVRGAHRVPETIHARYAATSRVYHYRILSGSLQPSAFEQGRVWHVHEELDVDAMRSAAEILLGRHDFSSFRAVGCQARDPVRTLDVLTVATVAHWPHFCPPQPAPRPTEGGDDGLVKSEPRGEARTGSAGDAAVNNAGEGLLQSEPQLRGDASGGDADVMHAGAVKVAAGDGTFRAHAGDSNASIGNPGRSRDKTEDAGNAGVGAGDPAALNAVDGLPRRGYNPLHGHGVREPSPDAEQRMGHERPVITAQEHNSPLAVSKRRKGEAGGPIPATPPRSVAPAPGSLVGISSPKHTALGGSGGAADAAASAVSAAPSRERRAGVRTAQGDVPSFQEAYREVVVTVKARSFLYHQVSGLFNTGTMVLIVVV
eukprot:jgi/Mesvir1/24508/Mv21854-RA.2